MLKKITALFTVISLVLCVLLLPSCSKLPSYVLYTGGERGTYYNLGTSISEMLEDNEDESGEKDENKFTANIVVKSSSGYRENIEALVSGDADLAILRNDIANSVDIYSSYAKTRIVAIAQLYPETVHIVAREDITSISELGGLNISLGDASGANEIIFKQILSESGVEEYNAVNMTVAASVQAFVDGEIDAFMTISGEPSQTVKDLASSSKFTLLSIDDDVIDSLCEKYPYFSPAEISKKNYSAIRENVKSVSLSAMLVTTKKLDKTTAYNIAKRLSEDTYLMWHDKADSLDPDKMWEGCPIELHSGANMYFEEYKAEKERLEKEEQERQDKLDKETTETVDTENKPLVPNFDDETTAG